MRKALLVVLILSAAVAWAQGGCTGQKPLNGMTTGGFLKGVANASVRVCSDALTPCTTIPLYGDAALTQSISNPVTTDATGNYQYCAAPGNYNEQLSGSGISGSVNNTPVTVSGLGSGDVAAASNTTFTGAISRQGDGEINAALMSGADVCAKISNAFAMANSLSWTSVWVRATSFHGSQACASSMFAGYPFTLGGGAGFSGTVQFGDINLLPDSSIVMPGHSAILGNARNNVGRSGTYIQASNNYATVSPKPLIQFGADLTSGNTGTPPEGIHLDNVNLDCNSPDNTHRAGMIGVLNGFAQENSGGDYVGVENCSIGLVRRNLGSISGAFNDGPYRNWHVRLNAQETTAMCFANGDDGTAMNSGKVELDDWSCNKGTGATQPTTGFQLDNRTGTLLLHKMHGEGFVNCFQLDSAYGANGIHIDDSDCTALAGFNQTAVVDIASTHAANNVGIVLTGIRPGGVTTNILNDHNTNGGLIPGTSQFDSLGVYVREKSNAVFSSRGEIPSTAFSTITGSATQSTSLMTLTGNASNSTAVSLFAISALGTNEKPFTITDTAASLSFSATAHQLQFTPLSTINATSGAQVNSPGILTQGKFWDGAASQSCSFTPNMSFSPSSGTATTASVSDTLTSCPGITTKQRDFSNYTKLILPALTTTATNCTSSGGTCTAAPAGRVSIAAAATTVVVATTAVTASSDIELTRDNSIGGALAVTCNTQSSLVLGTPYVSARTAGTSFTVTIDVAPTTNPLCLTYHIIN